jgi:hypothetical protein
MYHTEMEPQRIITAQDIKDILLGKQIKRIMLLEIFRKHNDKIRDLIGQGYSAWTLQRYETSLKYCPIFEKLILKTWIIVAFKRLTTYVNQI